MEEKITDEIIEEIWRIKSRLATEGNDSFEDLAQRIKREAATIEHRGETVDLRQQKHFAGKK